MVDFLKFFLKKSFEFILYRRNGTITFELSPMLLTAKSYFILKKENNKRDAFIALCSTGFQIFLVVIIKIKIFYVEVFKRIAWVFSP